MAVTDPLAELVRMTRAALAAAGLERRTLGENVYWIGGAEDAPPIVLVHGANDHAGTWAPIVPPLVPRFRLLLVDLPAHGESGPRKDAVRIPEIVGQLDAVITHELGDLPFTLVGNSLGAWITMLYVLEHPHRAQRLVLESGGGLSRQLGVPLVARNRDESLAVLRAVHGPHVAIAEWMVEALIERGTRSPLVQILQTDWKSHFVDARLGDIDVPTTLIWGALDAIVPRPYVDAIVSGIPGARIEIIDNAAHIPHAQQPEDFVRCLMATF